MIYIPYYRVSTAKQGKSGLGLEAQQAIVKAYIERLGGTILQEFTEVESGKSRSRPELMKAVELSKSKQAILIVAKLDRLARDAEFSFMISNRSHEIVCCDFPAGNKLMFGIMAVLAEYERSLISDRTKQAWKAKKARGYVHNTGATFTDEAREKSAQVRKQSVSERDAQVRAMAQMMKGSTLQEIADRLNELNYRTPKGGKYHKESVRRVLA
jgi:DNA invertase Pin-like site-specific DNA recombinase